MLKKITIVLVIVLIVQLGISAAIFWHQSQLRHKQQAHLLLSFKPQQVSHLIIEGDDAKLSLVKQQGHWVIPELSKLPADAVRVQELLEQLSTLKSAWPVADSPQAQQRFKVAKSHFHRHLELLSDTGTIANLYLGSSPEFRQVHLRREEDTAIYRVPLTVYPLPTSAQQWLDKGLLQAHADEITGPDFQIKKVKQVWQWQGQPAPDKQVLSQEQASLFANAISHLMIQKIAATPINGAAQAQLTVKQAGKTFSYQLWHQDKRYQIARSDYTQRFSISQTQYQQLTRYHAKTLLHLPKTKDKNSPKAPPVAAAH
ncbi:DUF4340 domain-containing protein [Celerinatantimonas sp. YJH-8]|uniref:DUF4340 domain-containing protein n=1 Tax=Celerinatantimonas sp. YJH-8 TaxID=3228714 RepID=UPI0038C7EAC3